jgi:hypothetical protein
MDWALKTVAASAGADEVLKAAKAFYAYVYENK